MTAQDNGPPTPPNTPPGWQPWQPPVAQPPPPPAGPGWAPQWAPPPTGYWQAPPQYANSTLAVIGAVVLMVMGVLIGLLSLAVLAFASGGEELLEEIDPTLIGMGGAFASVLMVIAVVMLLLAVLHVVSAIGVFMHKGWARWAGITAAVIGLIFGLLMVLGQVDAGGGVADFVIALIWLAAYGFATAALAAGGEHFTPRYPGQR